jgi:hypothetical protein
MHRLYYPEISVETEENYKNFGEIAYMLAFSHDFGVSAYFSHSGPGYLRNIYGLFLAPV